MTEESERDYLAIIWLGAGSSYVRHKDKYQAVMNLTKMVVSDWSSMFDLYGKEAKIGIFDVTGHDKLWWDHEVHVEGTNEIIPMLEVATVTLPDKQVWDMTKEEVIKAYANSDIGYEPATAQLMMLGVKDRDIDRLLTEAEETV